jgi:hypothetical protein
VRQLWPYNGIAVYGLFAFGVATQVRLSQSQLRKLFEELFPPDLGEIEFRIGYFETMRRFLGPKLSAASLATGLILVAGCENAGKVKPIDAAPVAEVKAPEVILGNDASKVELPAPINPGENLVAGMQAGKLAVLVFDKCPVDPAFTQSDPMGSLICGAKYNLFWTPATQYWTAIGPNESLKLGDEYGLTAGKYYGPAPSGGKVIVWGLEMSVGADASVTMKDGPIVGTLTYASATSAN